MVANSKMKSDSLITGNAINLHFSHLLTAVRFTIDESVQKGFIREISIDSVSSGGSLYFEDDTNDWIIESIVDYAENYIESEFSYELKQYFQEDAVEEYVDMLEADSEIDEIRSYSQRLR